MEPGLRSPQYWRARIEALGDLLQQRQAELTQAELAQKSVLEREVRLLRLGVFPEGYRPEEAINAQLKKHKFSAAPLNMVELMSLNTYFEIYPQKKAGQTIITSSRDFPLRLKGDRRQVEAALDYGMSSKLSLEAEALELELKLLAI